MIGAMRHIGGGVWQNLVVEYAIFSLDSFGTFFLSLVALMVCSSWDIVRHHHHCIHGDG